jgi:glycyl-tRNA synthetase beta subunit
MRAQNGDEINMCTECICISPCNFRARAHFREHRHGKRFLNKAEKIEKLKNYAEELKKERVVVEENIK